MSENTTTDFDTRLQALVTLSRRDPEATKPALAELLAEVRLTGEIVKQIQVLRLIARSHWVQEDVEGGMALLRECLTLATGPDGNKNLEGRILSDMAVAQDQRGNILAGLRYNLQAVEAYRLGGDEAGLRLR